MVRLTLGHSPDPDDAFMWWPLTGKVTPQGTPLAGPAGRPAIDTGRWEFASLPADIEALNRRAADAGDLDITALSVRAWSDVQDRHALTACGASFGDGYGPRVVARAGNDRVNCEGCLRRPGLRIAIPGRRTTAFLVLGLVLGPAAAGDAQKFVEMPFEQIAPAVQRGQVDAGLLIHEGQLEDEELKLVVDTGRWWKGRTGLVLPLGVNAVRRDLDGRFGAGSIGEVAGLLRRSVELAMERWQESVDYTMAFAEANARRAGTAPPGRERIDRYCRMYVTPDSRDMGERGREAIRRLLSEGAAAGLCRTAGALATV